MRDNKIIYIESVKKEIHIDDIALSTLLYQLKSRLIRIYDITMITIVINILLSLCSSFILI